MRWYFGDILSALPRGFSVFPKASWKCKKKLGISDKRHFLTWKSKNWQPLNYYINFSALQDWVIAHEDSNSVALLRVLGKSTVIINVIKLALVPANREWNAIANWLLQLYLSLKESFYVQVTPDPGPATANPKLDLPWLRASGLVIHLLPSWSYSQMVEEYTPLLSLPPNKRSLPSTTADWKSARGVGREGPVRHVAALKL